MWQWMLRITAYADSLLEDLDDLDWPDSVKEMQRNWIGRSEGAEVEFDVIISNGQQTNMKVLVLAPEHTFVSIIIASDSQSKHVEEYIELASKKSGLERTELQKEKAGVFTGCYARNPVNREAIPIWVADYVLGSYGTGAIIAVPAHDKRDHAFALKYNIPICGVVMPNNESFSPFENSYSGDGSMINSSCSTTGLDVNGLSNKEAVSRITEWLVKSGNGKRKMNGLEDEIERRPLTYTLWNQSKSMEVTGWHPKTFKYADSGPQEIKRIKGINHVYYDTEFRTEWCSNNSTRVPCYIFARKFSEGAAMPLLIEGVVGQPNTTKSLE